MVCAKQGCNRKTDLISTQCKCKNTYCLKHRYPEDHECTYNYRDHSDLEKKLIKVIASKIQQI